jgi:hypothetical protein
MFGLSPGQRGALTGAMLGSPSSRKTRAVKALALGLTIPPSLLFQADELSK